MSWFLKWTFFAVLVGLLPLWVPWGSKVIAGDSPTLAVESIRFGALVFYAYGLVIQVLKERWGELFVGAMERGGHSFRTAFGFLLEIASPCIVGGLCFLSFWAILGNREPPNSVIYIQTAAVLLAWLTSLSHRRWVAMALRH